MCKEIGECRAITLTDKVGEIFTGTDGNDTFSGVLDVQTVANGTVNVGDTIDGGEAATR